MPEDRDMIEPQRLEEFPCEMISCKRIPSWACEVIEEAKGHGVRKGTTKERNNANP